MTRSPSPAASAAPRARFACIDARAKRGDEAERAAAEAWAAGACGVEERDEAGGITRLLVYAPLAAAHAVRHALVTALGGDVAVGAAAPVPDQDWSETWRAGLAPIEISPRLVVRPSFAPFEARPGQACLVIDPAQAFGTGGHASTRLALEALAALPPERLRGARVLDAGTGTGVLALAALRLGAATAVGFDLDPLATEAAQANARANDLADRARFFLGPVDAVAGAGFDVVVANLLRSELLPIAAGLVARARPGATLVLAGLLARERAEVERAFEALGCAAESARTIVDASGEEWVGITLRRT